MTAPRGPELYRIDWLPGSDVLNAHCFCGARSTAEDPERAWSWLLDHPRHATHTRPTPPTLHPECEAP